MNRYSRRAFTLLELLVAMAIVAVLAISLVSSLRAAFAAKESAENSLETARSADLVMDAIRNDIQSALPPTRGTFEQSFEGTNNPRGDGFDDLVFFTTAPASLHMVNGIPIGNGDIKEIELTAYQPANSKDIVFVRRTWNNLLDPNLQQSVQQNGNQPPSAQLGDEEVLCRHVVALNFQYYSTNSQSWATTWDSTASSPVNVLPNAVQVTLQLESPELNPDHSPKLVTYTRIFQFPCNGASNDSATTSTSSSSSGGTN